MRLRTGLRWMIVLAVLAAIGCILPRAQTVLAGRASDPPRAVRRRTEVQRPVLSVHSAVPFAPPDRVCDLPPAPTLPAPRPLPFLIAIAPESAPSGIPIEPEQVCITGQFKAEPLRVALGWIAQASGHFIWVPPDIDDCITMKFTAMPWREAVERACDIANCITRPEGNGLIVVKPPRVTMEFRDADLREVIDLLAKQAGVGPCQQ